MSRWLTLWIAGAVLLTASGCAHQDEWTRGDTVWQSIAFAAMAADAYGSSKIREHPNIIEDGPIARHALGRNPDPGSVWLYMATVAASNYLIARALPRGWRTMWQVSAIAQHGLAVNDLHQLGVFSEPCTVNPCGPR